MTKYVLRLFVLACVGWLAHQFIYQTPNQRLMAEKIREQNTVKAFTEGFEGISTESQLFADDWSTWHELVLQNNNRSIRRPIKYCLINYLSCATTPSLGNHIELVQDIRRRGKNALKFQAGPFPNRWLKGSKVALRRQLFNFKKGDDLYFSGWFYFTGEDDKRNSETDNLKQLSFLSFRSANKNLRTYGEPGLELFVHSKNHLAARITNWSPGMPEIQQDLLNRVKIPLNQWVEIKVHLKLSEDENQGVIEVWQNKNKVLSQRAQTLPSADSVYSILEIGVSSNLNENETQTFYVDNIALSSQRLNQ